MFNNYQYFIALAEEQSMQKAAKRLYISHQSLSKYLKKLEETLGATLFERNGGLVITPAGMVYLEAARKVGAVEEGMLNQIKEICDVNKKRITIGTTKARFDLIAPRIMQEHRKEHVDIEVDFLSEESDRLYKQVLNDSLDMAILNENIIPDQKLKVQTLLREKMYLIISDEYLRERYKENYPQCKERLLQGADLRDFLDAPFLVDRQGKASRNALERYFELHGRRPEIMTELSQLNLQLLLAAKNEEICFCWTMHLPLVWQINRIGEGSHLNAFPLTGIDAENRLILIMRQEKILREHEKAFVNVVKKVCKSYMRYEKQEDD